MRDAPEIIYTIVLATIFFMLLVVILLITVWRYYSRKRSHEMEVIQFEHTLLQTRLEIQEKTFQGISQELHDNLGQLLSLAKLNLTTATLDRPDEAREKMNGAIDLVSLSIQSIRDLAKTLHPESVNRVGLLAALETEVRIIEKLKIMQPVFQVSGTMIDLDDNRSLIIFRIVQEALHNVIRHAKATLVEIHVDFTPETMKMMVRDNGVGIVIPEKSDGSGLRNMKDRARMIGADLDVESAPGKGTAIRLTIPVK